MKKMKKGFLLISMLLMGISLTFSQTATLTLPELGGGLPAGDVFFQMTVTTDGDGVATGQFFVNYDPAVLTPVDVIYEAFGTNSFPFYEWGNNLAYGPGEMLLSWLQNNGTDVFPANGEIMCTIQMTYTGNDDFSDLSFGESKGVDGYPEKGWSGFYNASITQLAMTYENGSVGPTGPLATAWNGSASNVWDLAANWDAGIPDATTDATIPAGMPNDPTIFNAGAATMVLDVNAGASLTIAPMADLTTNGMFTNDGDFVIESLAPLGTGEAGSFIDMAGVGGTGMFEFQRDITNVTPYGSQVGWHLISSPLPAGELTSDDFYYFFLNTYDNATQMYSPIEGEYPCVPAATVANGLMEGWSIKYDDNYSNICGGGVEDYMINMMGSSFNTGAQGATYGADWNLLGNPYPSAIDVDAITWDGGLTTNTVYMWDGWSTSTWVLGFNGNGNSIPPAQGFFVEGAAAGSFDFAGTERFHDNGQWWYKDASDLLSLQATVEGLTNSDITYIRFNDVSTTGLDKEWDANKMFAGVTETPQIYTTSNGLELALNTQPEVPSVPMSFICGAAGTYTIEALETGTFSHVVLEDAVTGEQTDLLAGSYTFDYSDVEEVHPFIVHFTPMGTIENNANDITIYSNENNIYVNVPEYISGDIVVVNLMGQEVLRTDVSQGLNILPMADANTYYVVKVVSNEQVVTGKVYIK